MKVTVDSVNLIGVESGHKDSGWEQIEREQSVFRLRVVLILTHNLTASVIEVTHQGRAEFGKSNRLSAFLSPAEGANRRRIELSQGAILSRPPSLFLATK